MEEKVKRLEELVEAGDLAGALDFLEAMPLEERQDWRVQNLTGIVSVYCGRPQEAETFFRAALEQRPGEPDVLYNLSEALAAQGKNAEQAEGGGGETPAPPQKRLLMFAYYFPPLSGSGVFRSLKFAKYLPKFGWQPTVISTDRPPNGWNYADESMVAEIPAGMEVTRIPDVISTGRETSIASQRVQEVLNFLHGILRNSQAGEKIFSQMLKAENGPTSLFTFPCPALSWAYDAARYAEERMDLSSFDAVYTTSGPSSAHLIGFYLHRKYGVPWVADWRDPWTLNAYGADYDPSNPGQRLLFELENILLREAGRDIIIYGTGSLARDYVRTFQIPAEKLTGILNGYDEEDFAPLQFRQEPSDKFTITYSGLLYTAQRDVAPVLTVLKELAETGKIDLSKVRLKIVGSSDKDNMAAASRYGLGDILVQTGYVSHAEALQAELDADVLLLLVGDEPRFRDVYTGKLFEYLRAGRPILALAPEGGVVDRVLKESGHGKAFRSTQTGEIADMLLREYHRWEKGKARRQFHSAAIQKFERQELTRQLAGALEKVCEERKKERAFEDYPSSIYNDGYKAGGAGGTYHRHYTQSIYYPSWRKAISYLYLLDRTIPILEIACGVGQFANMLFDYGFTNYTGFDFAEEAVALARKNNPEHAQCFHVADAFTTDLLDRKYGLVICFEMLEHIQKDLKLLSRIRSGTKLLLSVPNFDDPLHVRYFSSAEAVRERYQTVMHVIEVQESVIQQPNCLFYITGEKL